MAWFRSRTVEEELEVHLADATGAVRAKAERKRYGTGEERFKFRATGLESPDGARAELQLDGRPIASMPIKGGRASIDIESPADVPAVSIGQRLELVVAGTVLLAGTFRAE